MAGFLTPMNTAYKIPDLRSDTFLSEVREPDTPIPRLPANARKPETPEDVLEILKHEPDYDSLIASLEYLKKGDSNFSITSPSPLSAQLVHILVSETVPTYWNVLHTSQNGNNSRILGRRKGLSNLDLLLSCLRSVMGLNAILLSLNQFIQNAKETKKTIGRPNILGLLNTLLEALSALLEGTGTIEGIAHNIWNTSDSRLKQKAVWNEFLGIVSGKILGISAEAEDVINELSKKIGEKHWVSNGRLYSNWLACNISHWAQSPTSDTENDLKSRADLLSKSFRLGYTGTKLGQALELDANILQIVSSKSF
jgi:telomere length regulation protein